MKQGFFITGTDTEVGKTRISVGVIELLKQQGLRVAAMKPVASGCESTDEGLRNEDAVQLSEAASVKSPYYTVNPYAFAPAIAPHLAAQYTDTEIVLLLLEQHFQALAQQADSIVVEGAGGWQVPINADQTLADVAVAFQLPVILVVAIKLGCINHALLTADAILSKGLALAGWVANDFLSEKHSEDIINSIQSRINAPCLGRVPALTAAQSAAGFLTLP